MNRKEHVINILNESYKEDEGSFKPKESIIAAGDDDMLNLGDSAREPKHKSGTKKKVK